MVLLIPGMPHPQVPTYFRVVWNQLQNNGQSLVINSLITDDLSRLSTASSALIYIENLGLPRPSNHVRKRSPIFNPVNARMLSVPQVKNSSSVRRRRLVSKEQITIEMLQNALRRQVTPIGRPVSTSIPRISQVQLDNIKRPNTSMISYVYWNATRRKYPSGIRTNCSNHALGITMERKF